MLLTFSLFPQIVIADIINILLGKVRLSFLERNRKEDERKGKTANPSSVHTSRRLSFLIDRVFPSRCQSLFYLPSFPRQT